MASTIRITASEAAVNISGIAWFSWCTLQNEFDPDEGKDQRQPRRHEHKAVKQAGDEEEQWAQSEQGKSVRGEDDV